MKPTFETAGIKLYLGDCMELMRNTPDKAFDLAIVDTPYGIGESGDTNHTRGKLAVAKTYKAFFGGDAEAPQQEYFEELRRVSKNQIVWGANHFMDRMPISSPCWLVWDKLNGDNDFADCELAWTSFKTSVRKFEFRWAGMLQGDMRNKECRIHPTQKPVALYSWLLANYAKKGDKILDTHLGSGSHAISCIRQGFELTATEIDADYFAGALDRIQRELAQGVFQFEAPKPQPTQETFAI